MLSRQVQPRCNVSEVERDKLPDNIGEAQSRGSGVFLSRSFAQDASPASLGLAGDFASSKTAPALCLMLGSTCGRSAPWTSFARRGYTCAGVKGLSTYRYRIAHDARKCPTNVHGWVAPRRWCYSVL